MPAIPMPLSTPWTRAVAASLAAALAAWWQRPQPRVMAELPPLDERLLRDMGLADGLRHASAEHRHSRAVERIANGLPAEWSR